MGTLPLRIKSYLCFYIQQGCWKSSDVLIVRKRLLNLEGSKEINLLTVHSVLATQFQSKLSQSRWWFTESDKIKYYILGLKLVYNPCVNATFLNAYKEIDYISTCSIVKRNIMNFDHAEVVWRYIIRHCL